MLEEIDLRLAEVLLGNCAGLAGASHSAQDLFAARNTEWHGRGTGWLAVSGSLDLRGRQASSGSTCRSTTREDATVPVNGCGDMRF